MNESFFGTGSLHICHLNLWTAVLFDVFIVSTIIVIVPRRKRLSSTMQGVAQRKIGDTIYVEVLGAGTKSELPFSS